MQNDRTFRKSTMHTVPLNYLFLIIIIVIFSYLAIKNYSNNEERTGLKDYIYTYFPIRCCIAII